jgi:hypothetical protein
MNQFIEKRLPVIRFIIDCNVNAFYPFIQWEEWLFPPLVGSDNNNVIPPRCQVIGFIAEHPLHATGIICP